MHTLGLPKYKANGVVIIHKDDDGRIDAPVIKLNAKGKEFTMSTALRYMRTRKLANDGIRSGWFVTTEIALARAKWA
jgi:hypothetical protein